MYAYKYMKYDLIYEYLLMCFSIPIFEYIYIYVYSHVIMLI